jgi:hypothetical protein
MASNLLGSSTAVEKHVDQMETIETTFVVPVLVVLLAAASIPKDFEILGIHVETADAYGIVVAIFDCLLLLFCTTCWKAADLLKACGDEEKGRAIVAVVTHKWLLNPFSYSGEGFLSAINCAVGAGLLTFCWWGGLCGLKLLAGVTHNRDAFEICMYGLYFAVGAVAVIAVGRLIKLIVRFSDHGNAKSSEGGPLEVRWVRVNLVMKSIFSVLASALGYWLYYSFSHIA